MYHRCLRRPGNFPLILLATFLIVFCGTRSFFDRTVTSQEEMLEIVDPVDFEVPVSEGKSFVSADASGKPFPAQAIEQASFLDDVLGSSVSSFTSEEVVFVTYASSNHFYESRESIRNLRMITNSTIVYYDIGLQSAQVEDLRTVCNLKVVLFDFSRYPPHAKNLMTYAFKPILMAEVYQKYKAFWVIDASARFYSTQELEIFYASVRKGKVAPFSAEHPAGHTILSATHEGMYSFLPLPMETGKLSGMRQALTMFSVRSKMAREIVKWNMICALTEACMAPPGASPFCGLPSSSHRDPNCHRFDQSSVNIIMCAINLRRNLSCLPQAATRGAFSPLVGVERGTGYDGPLPRC